MEPSGVLWTLLSVFFIGLSYFAALALIFGLAAKLWSYLRTPMPWPGTITPAPQTNSGAALRVAGDAFLFLSLFKTNKPLWLGAKLLHIPLLMILIRHLRYFTYPVPSLVTYLEPVALIFGYLFGIAILYLLWRRLALPRTLYISNLPDYFVLVLLGGIAVTGILVSQWLHVSIVDVKAYVLGLMTLHPVAPPNHPLFLLHLFLVLLLMIYFPASKLLHAGGIFFSPARNQPWQVQEAGNRYVNEWDK